MSFKPWRAMDRLPETPFGAFKIGTRVLSGLHGEGAVAKKTRAYLIVDFPGEPTPRLYQRRLFDDPDEFPNLRRFAEACKPTQST